MKYPPLATHRVSLPTGTLNNNELGYCSSKSTNPNAIVTLTPVGTAWSKRTWQGQSVVVKWLRLDGEPEFLHVLDGETSTTMRLPRRLLQRSSLDVVTIQSVDATSRPTDALVHYATATAFRGNFITVTPLGQWLDNLLMGAGVHVSNLSDPRNPLKSGTFTVQSNVVKRSNGGVLLLKDSPGG